MASKIWDLDRENDYADANVYKLQDMESLKATLGEMEKEYARLVNNPTAE